MPKVSIFPVPKPFVDVFRHSGIKIKKFSSPASFERALKKFLRRNHVLHLSTCKNNDPRSTPLEYRLSGLTFYVLSEGGAKFVNLKENQKVSFSIAEPYSSEEDFWGYKGMQAWGTAKIYCRREHPRQFAAALKKMGLAKTLKRLGLSELPPQINYRLIEITPDRIKYGNPREGVFRAVWSRKG
jgi:hypothetical protein